MALKDIEIKFSAKGDDVLIQTIQKLDRATKALVKTQSTLVGEGKKHIQSQNKHTSATKKVNIELALQGSNWKKAGISAELYKKAVKGNQLALAKVRIATKKHIEALGRQKKGLLETVHSTRILGGTFAVLRSKLLIASFAMSMVGATVGRLAKSMGEQEKAEKRLETALGRRSKALLAFASSQQRVTAFGDEETISAMSLLGAYTDNEKAIARLTEASMDLAVAKGLDLNSAVDLVSKSVFSSTNALSRYGIQIEGTTGSVQRLESATKNITDLYGGQAEAHAETFLGSMIQLGNSTGDVAERLGSFFVPAILFATKGLKAFADNLNEKAIKSYGTALLTVSGAYGVYAIWSKRASLATLKLGRAMKLTGVGLVVAGLGFAIDKLGIFGDESGKLTDDLKKLEGELGALNASGNESLTLNHRLAQSQLTYGLALAETSEHEKERATLMLEYNQIREKHGVTEANFGRMIQDNKEFAIEYNKNMAKQVVLEQKIRDAKIATVSTLVGALGQMHQSMKGSAILSKRLAQTQAIIDTYAGATKALASGKPPWNMIAMAAVIAKGLSNVATIEAQKFAKGGEFVTNRPEIIMVGEAGREHVKVTPIDRPESRALNDGGITINIMGGIVQDDYIVNELLPAINKAKALA